MPKSPKTVDDSKGQKTPKSVNNKEVTSTKQQANSPSNKLAKVPADDCTNTANVHTSDKLNNKPDNKPRKLDAELAEIAQVWPSLPKAIRTAIVAIVRASNEERDE